MNYYRPIRKGTTDWVAYIKTLIRWGSGVYVCLVGLRSVLVCLCEGPGNPSDNGVWRWRLIGVHYGRTAAILQGSWTNEGVNTDSAVILWIRLLN